MFKHLIKISLGLAVCVCCALGTTGNTFATESSSVLPSSTSGTSTGSTSGVCPPGSLRYNDDAGLTSAAQCNMPKEKDKESLMGRVQDIINVIIGVLGVVTVAVIIIGGVTYITSQGEAAKITKAKNIILYGIVGLIIALLAFAIVNFILKGVFS